MTKYRVTIIAKMLETYEVEAEDAEQAEENWQDGTLVSTDDSLECEIISVEESADTVEAKEQATGMEGRDMRVFDNYEIRWRKRFEEPDSPGKAYFEVCEPHEADVWTLYGHVNGEAVQAIGDFASPEHAEEIFFRITGIAFTGSYKPDARLRIMHAGPKLLETLKAASEWIDAQHFVQRTLIQETIRQAIAEATGRAL